MLSKTLLKWFTPNDENIIIDDPDVLAIPATRTQNNSGVDISSR